MGSKKIIKKIYKDNDSTDVILIKNGSESFIDKNFFYVTGLENGLFENCSVLIFPNGNIQLIVSTLEAGLVKDKDFDLFIYKNQNEYKNILKKLLKKVNKIGLNYNGISMKSYKSLNKIFLNKKFIDISNDLIKSRMVKEDYEIEKIKKACQISDKVVKKIPDIIKIGMKEYELAAEIDYEMQKNGADNPAFLTISSFGKNSANPHYSHGNNILKNNDIVLCDFGACFNRYNSDITRCFIMGSKNKQQNNMYNTVVKAQESAIEHIKEGVKANKIHNIAEKIINNTKFKDLFIHSTGHSLGLDVHDPGFGINSISSEILKENMVFTVEPGIYQKGYGGIRLEDDILVKKEKFEYLSKSNKEFIEI